MARSNRTRWAKQEVQLTALVVQARKLRAQGLTYEAIGKIQGCGKRTAERRVKRGLAKVLDESAEDWKKIEILRLEKRVARGEESLKRLDKIIKAHMPAAKTGNVEAADVVVKSEQAKAKIDAGLRQNGESLRKLLGLDAPDKHEHTGAVAIGPTILIPAERPDDAADPAPGRLAPESGPPN